MISVILTIASVMFFLCSGYQLFYLIVPHITRKAPAVYQKQASTSRCAALICARNEAAVIDKLIHSLKSQSYPISVFVIADNCTDNTAIVAKLSGATVWERFNSVQIGKGYALSELLRNMEHEGYIFDRYFIFDADNYLSENCIYEMNRVFDMGFPIVTGYRCASNFSDNWISAGYGVFFLRESVYLNRSRMLLGTSCAVSGTGFGFTREILCEQKDGEDLWRFHLLTEDLEFTAHHVINGHRIGYAHNAVFYDEQPSDIVQSWRQRLRWAKGGLQVVAKYGKKLLQSAFEGHFSCFDMLMSSFPAVVYNLVCILCHTIMFISGAINGDITLPLISLFKTLAIMYFTFFIMGAATMISESKRIPLKPFKKALYTCTFPLFMLTYIPISIASLCCKVEWKPITHHFKGAIYEQHSDM